MILDELESVLASNINDWNAPIVPLKNLHSYRGYYERAAFEPSFEGSTVLDLIKEVREALDGKEYTGWLGGTFVFREDTPVYLANEGETGKALMEIQGIEQGQKAIVKAFDTSPYEFYR